MTRSLDPKLGMNTPPTQGWLVQSRRHISADMAAQTARLTVIPTTRRAPRAGKNAAGHGHTEPEPNFEGIDGKHDG